MKLALSLTLSFLLFAFITQLPLAFSNDVEPVLDIHGDPLVSGVEYRIRASARFPPTGGLKLAKTEGLDCPVTVLYDAFIQGIPVIFTRVPAGTIYIGIPLSINFRESKKPECAESSRWLVFLDDDIGKACVGIGGPKNYPGEIILSGYFDIQKSNLGYKLQFRPIDAVTSSDIGTYDNDQEGGSRLILTEHEAFDVEFIPESSYNINNDGIIKSVA